MITQQYSKEPQWKQDSNMWLNLLEQQLYQQAQTAKLLMVFCSDEQTAKEILSNFVSGIHWMFKYFDKTTKLAYSEFITLAPNPEAPNPKDRFTQLLAEAQKARKYEQQMLEIKQSMKATMHPINFNEPKYQRTNRSSFKKWDEVDSRDLLQKLQAVVNDGKRRASLQEVYQDVANLYEGYRTWTAIRTHIANLKKAKQHGYTLLPGEEDLFEYFTIGLRQDLCKSQLRPQVVTTGVEAVKVE